MASCPVVPAYRIFQACNNCGAVDGSGCMDQILWVTLFMKNHTHNRNLNTRTDLEFSGKFAQKVPTNLGDQTAVLRQMERQTPEETSGVNWYYEAKEAYEHWEMYSFIKLSLKLKNRQD
eukprot:672263_1